MAEEREFVSLTKALYSTIQKNGVKGATEILKRINKSNPAKNYQLRMVDFIIEEVVNTYDTVYEDLTTNYVYKDNRDARTTCFFLMKRHVGLTNGEIANHFKRKQPALVTFALNDVKNKNPKIAQDKKFMQKLDKIEKRVLEFRNKLLENA